MRTIFTQSATCFAILVGCSSFQDKPVDTIEVQAEPQVTLSWEKYRATVQPYAGGLLVEGDLFFADENALRAHYEESRLAEAEKLVVAQRASGPTAGEEPVFVGSEALDIVYCVANTFPDKPTAVADIATATLAWQQVANVRFRYDASQDTTCNQDNENVDFAFMNFLVPSGDQPLGCGVSKKYWQVGISNGCPTQNGQGLGVRGVLLIRYSTSLPFPAPWDPISRVGVLKHELGHILGFRHEHPWAPNYGGCGATEMPETGNDLTGRQLTAYDQASVMHYPQCDGILGVDLELSKLDGEGARSIYGMPAAWYVPILL